jgi:hypothetical protein
MLKGGNKMGCNCKVTEGILAILIVLFAFWQTTYSKWVIIISAVLLLIHALKCGKCKTCGTDMKDKSSSGTKKKKR